MEILVAQTEEALELKSPMPVGRRVLFLLLALFPLLAPYELILRPRWESYWNIFFLIACIISAGAVALSAFLVWAAVAGLSTGMRFDKTRGMLAYTAEAPVLPRRTEDFPLREIADLRVETHDWSDSSPSYSFEVVLRDGRKITLGSAWSRAEVEALRDRTAEFLGMESAE